MPYSCCVPQCPSVSNKEKVMFHKLPNDQTMLKKWLIAIRSNIKKIDRNTKICSKHFEEECYIVTSMGQWRILKKTAIPSLNIPKRKFETPEKKRSDRCERYQKRLGSINLTDTKDQEAVVEMVEVTLEPEIEPTNNINLEDVPNDDDDFVENRKIQESQSVQTIITCDRSQLISHEFLTEDQLKHFTGFSRKLFTFFVEVFGNSYCKVHSTLSVENELLIMLMKYRLNLFYSTLSNFFSVDIRTISNIFVKWTKHLYTCLKQINFWNIASTKEDQYKVILDCTEVFIERSSDPIIQQATYSSYYGTNTFKILVACTEKGEIIYVSDVYGGSISDRKITVESGILEHIEEGQFVLADRGFDISDLLEEKGIHLNIPPFKKGDQLSEEDIMKTRAVANRRIIVENIIGLAKKHKILKDRIPSKLFRYSNEIIYNCFMICNFKNSIVNA